VEYLYNNNLQEAKDYPTRIVDTAGRDRRFTYDSLGRLISATDLGDAVTTYAYGEDGISLITAPTGETRSYSYDDQGNLAGVLYGDGTTTQFTYSDIDNNLTQTTLGSGDTISYTYNDAGQIISETSTSSGVISTTYTTDGAISTVQNSNGTVQYYYDVNGALSGIDSPNGSSVRYERDLLGRVVKISEKATSSSAAMVTEYVYDAVGNLKSVVDPTGGITTMTYDAVNRLEKRVLPNGITTTYTYNLVDQVTSIVHKASDGTVVASLAYERGKGGEPTKITREDGSYTQVTYDGSLRVTKEEYFNSSNTLTETISYSYDASGKRTSKVDKVGTHNYAYDAGFKLKTVTEASETEQYAYDVDGRLTQTDRDGNSIDLNHDNYDHLTEVNNTTTGQKVSYLYDAQGRRIGEKEGTTERRYLVAPTMGGGLDVQDLITDGAGNLLSNHVYMGAAPLMRLDANGNAVYYLTDGMGSVIELADRSGQTVVEYRYDGFGNLRGSVGNDVGGDAIGGDFRFQGQWYESESGLYYMRARDYDSQTGTFISRDPVDVIETEPESFNPYQFVYNNPYVFSDPTGMFSIAELNAADVVQKILNSIENGLKYQFQQEVKDRAKGIATNILSSVMKSILPTQFEIDKISGQHGLDFEYLITQAICSALPLPSFATQSLWIDAGISSEGEPTDNGFHCPPVKKENPDPYKDGSSHPDFIFSNIAPLETGKTGKGYLIGDFKFNVGAIKEQTDKQLKAMLSYAKLKGQGTINKNSGGHQYIPFAMYISAQSVSSDKERKLQRWAMDKYKVYLEILDFGKD
jgi:RHS repeat-associated protein